MAQTATRKCIFCDNIAIFFCYECKEAFCKQCKGNHDKLSSTKNHSMTDLKRVDLTQFKSAPDCTEHELEFSYYCNRCRVLICNECVVNEHKGHDISSVKTIADTLRKSASNKSLELKSRISSLSKSISKIKSEYLPKLHHEAQTIISSIKSTAEEVKKIVDWKADIKIGDVGDSERSQETELQSSLATIERIFRSQDATCRSLEKLLTEEHAVTFFVSYQSLKNEIDMLDYDVDKVEPRHIPGVSTKSLCDDIIQGINMHVERFESTCSPCNIPKILLTDDSPAFLPNVGTETNAAKTTSTPVPSRKLLESIEPNVSDISSSEHSRKYMDSDMSGVEDIYKSSSSKKADTSKSFINPFDLSIEFTEDVDVDDDSCDPDYEPSCLITMCDQNVPGAEDVNEEDDIDETEDFSDKPEVELGPGVYRVKTVEGVESILDNNPVLVFMQQLKALAKTNLYRCVVNGCGLGLQITTETVGSAVYLKWVCPNDHVSHTWCSQPVLNRRLHAGDLLFASAIFASGCNFQKIQMFSNFIKLPILSKCTYFRIQRTYLIPSIDDFWTSYQNEVIRSFQGQDLVVTGDGRMDSPGHCAQYCSYTFMEYNTKQILHIITMDKRETDKKSTNMEKACFVKGLQFLLGKGLKIVEVVTDAHLQVAAYMTNYCPGERTAKHQALLRHLAWGKEPRKKIVAVGNEREKKDLLNWKTDVVNHYWYCANMANTKEEFIGIWIGILHHVTNVHEWRLSYSDTNSCKHGPLTEEREKGWLKKNSPAHEALSAIVLDKRLLNNIPYYINFRSTAEMENFQNLILMYASKRHSYRPPAYRGRNLLAALDHNNHLQRQILTKKDGSIRWNNIKPLGSCKYTIQPIESTEEHIVHAHLPRVDSPEDFSPDYSKILDLMWTHQDYFDQKVLSRAQAEYNFYSVLQKEWKRAEKRLMLEEIKYPKFTLKFFMDFPQTRPMYALILTILEQCKDKKLAEAAAEEYSRLSVLERTMIQQKIITATPPGIDMDSAHYNEMYEDMKTRFKSSAREVQLRQPSEFKMIPLFEYLKLKETIVQQRKQIEELASRLSEIAIRQLAEGETGFTYHADKSRPQELGERFAELFDETWSSAYESLRPKHKGEVEEFDEKTMDLLQNVLKVIYEFCLKASKLQIERMVPLIVDPMNTSGSKKVQITVGTNRTKMEDMIKQCTKVIAPATIEVLQKEIYEKQLKGKFLIEPVGNEVQKHLQQCIDLIWYMCIQQPAMEIVWAKKGEKFNREQFRFSVKKGKTYKFTVWPAVFLHKDGPLVAPGYAVPE